MAKFDVHGPYDFGTNDVDEAHGLIRGLTDESIDDFRKKTIARRHGVYVFALRGQGGSVVPWYVGLAKQMTFGDEAFSKDKLRKYAAAMFGRTGKPILTVLAAPKNGPKGSAIDDLETLLIWIARAQNPRLLNERKINTSPRWILALTKNITIQGVINSGQGQPTREVKQFKAMMGL